MRIEFKNRQMARLASIAQIDAKRAAVELDTFEALLRNGRPPLKSCIDRARQRLFEAERRIQGIYEAMGVEV